MCEVKMETEELVGRLLNWRFESAKIYYIAESQEVKDTVDLLARLFGNYGWFSGDMGELTGLVVDKLCEDLGYITDEEGNLAYREGGK